MDWATIGALGVAVIALLKAFIPTKTSAESHSTSTNQEVDSDVLAKFLGLTDRMADLEGQLAALRLELKLTKDQLDATVLELKEMQKLEEYLRSKLHEKDKEVLGLQADLASRQAAIERLKGRVQYLEEKCRDMLGDDE